MAEQLTLGAGEERPDLSPDHDTKLAEPVLPNPWSSFISLAAITGSFALDATGFIAGVAIEGARIGTVAVIELGRAAISASRDASVETLVEADSANNLALILRSILSPNSSILDTSAKHLTTLISAGFEVGSISLSSSLTLSRYALLALDAVFGNNETSKAVGAIALLVHRHYSGTSNGHGQERLKLGDFIVGVAGFALLQRWSKERTKLQWRENGVEESIWTSIDGHDPAKASIPISVQDICRYARFAIASYGKTYLTFTGSAIAAGSIPASSMSALLGQHHDFTSYVDVPASSILISSYVDSHGTSTGVENSAPDLPITYYISLDHASQAVVLTCRGTLGFEDILTDMICDSVLFTWQNKNYTAHQGILNSARRLLTIHNGRIPTTLNKALVEHPTYRLILCGHSLGGGVATILGLLISEPTTVPSGATDPIFRTSAQTSANLPANRPVYVYAYGPAAAVSPALQHATRGLVFTFIHGVDVVPSLSLGNLADMQHVANAFRSRDASTNETCGDNDATQDFETLPSLRKRTFGALRSRTAQWTGIAALEALLPESWRGGEAGSWPYDADWAWQDAEMLRARMVASKLVPAGRVYVIESLEVEANAAASPLHSGALKITHVPDVATRFGELRVETAMITSHLPVAYERVFQRLEEAVNDLSPP